MSKNITEKNKFEGGKTRIQSLKDRIDTAFETLRNLYDESKLEKIGKKSQRPSKTKLIQYDLEEVANKIVSKEGTVNLKTLEAKLETTGENNLEESREQLSPKEIEINSPFINRMQFILKELNQLKNNSIINEGELDQEVSKLPKDGFIILSLSKNKLKIQHQKLIDSQQENSDYVKKLES